MSPTVWTRHTSDSLPTPVYPYPWDDNRLPAVVQRVNHYAYLDPGVLSVGLEKSHYVVADKGTVVRIMSYYRFLE